MYTGLFDIFSIGIGPSSSHTMGPMRAAARFVREIRESGVLADTSRVCVELFGSLALTGEGHCTPQAVVYGLLGLDAETMDPQQDAAGQVQSAGRLALGGEHEVDFDVQRDVLLRRGVVLPGHANGMRMQALGADGTPLHTAVYYSVGGGTVLREDELGRRSPASVRVPYEFGNCRQLMDLCEKHGLSVAQLVLLNELSLHAEEEIDARLDRILRVMDEAVERGLAGRGVLPGPLHLPRRAPSILADLEQRFRSNAEDALTIIDWINLWAFAVSEENAAGGRVVTAPTMGSAGVIPAVLRYFSRYGYREAGVPCREGQMRFLLTASAICCLYRTNASISGAEVGCQGEVGVACSMAAAGLVAAMGGSNACVENAAEIAMEHNLGLTCDPICGLVQVPCIERNAIGAVKAVNAARLALRGGGSHFVSLDSVIAAMDETGRALSSRFRETSLGGLAKNAFTC